MSNTEKAIILAAALIAAVLIIRPTYCTIYAPRAAAPLITQIDIDIGHEYDGMATVFEGETITANWTGTWENKTHSPYGGDNVAALWFLDGEFIKIAEGGTESISQTWCNATNETVPGCFNESQWNWQTIPIAGTLPIQGSKVNVNGSAAIDTIGLSKGLHQITVKAFAINGSSNNRAMFADGGVCFPLQTGSQGFPCAGIFGTSLNRSKSESPRCTQSTDLYWGTVYQCPVNDWTCGSCLSWCCQTTGERSICPSSDSVNMFAFCDGVAYRNWSGWSEWAVTVEQTQETVMANAIATATTIAIAEFEVVSECQTECCIGEPGVQDKLCSDGKICSNGSCLLEIMPCPTECCVGDQRYQEKPCLVEGQTCSLGVCQTPTTPCGFECCEGIPNVQDKLCPADETCNEANVCEAGTVPPDDGVDWGLIAVAALMLLGFGAVIYIIIKRKK
jgi:hypothetical protein